MSPPAATISFRERQHLRYVTTSGNSPGNGNAFLMSPPAATSHPESGQHLPQVTASGNISSGKWTWRVERRRLTGGKSPRAVAPDGHRPADFVMELKERVHSRQHR
jgi:hypothetical protein